MLMLKVLIKLFQKFAGVGRAHGLNLLTLGATVKNLTMLTDLYELTMMQGYFESGTFGKDCVFDMYFRKNPCDNGYSIFAGLEQFLDYIEGLRFWSEDLDYLRGLGLFTEPFLEYLRNFRFTGDIHAMHEGTLMFPYEPIVRVKAPIMEAQLIESALLNIINHQSLVATKAARVVEAARGDKVLEFGLRRALGPDSAVYGARAAIIGGCAATSNVLCAQMFDVPVKGTHAHSWIMSFPDELTAFRTYAKAFPGDLMLLVDTYDTLKSGVPNAITVFKELLDSGAAPRSLGIRLDSGDLAFLSKTARQMLDDAGLGMVTICASNDLDEDLITSLKLQGAAVTLWGVGTNLITSKGCSSLGGVYKLVAEQSGDGWLPRIKLSNNPEKITTPGLKKVYRLLDKESGKIKADLVTLDHEVLDMANDLTIFDPKATWRRMTLAGGRFEALELLIPVITGGKRVYKSPPVLQISAYAAEQKRMLWDEHKRFIRPHIMPVDLSQELYDLKQRMIYENQ